MNNILRIFSEKNLKILETIQAKEGLNIRDLAKASGCSAAQAHNAVKIFIGLEIADTKKIKNMLLVYPRKESRLIKKINSLLREADTL